MARSKPKGTKGPASSRGRPGSSFPARTRRRTLTAVRRLRPWQTLLAGAIGAIAVVITALIGLGSSSRTPSAPPSATQLNSSPGVYITSMSEKALPGGKGVQYVIHGTVRDTNLDNIYVVVDQVSAKAVPAATNGPEKWLVSPPAKTTRGGNWTVIWDLPRPPTNAEWIAVAMLFSGTAPPCPPAPIPCLPPVEQYLLAQSGSRAHGVQASSTPVRG